MTDAPNIAALSLDPPGWFRDVIAKHADVSISDVNRRMVIAVEMARQNVARGTGGPFGAAVFSLSSHQLVSVGANLVVAAKCSVLHAEIVAIISAQQRVGHHRLDESGDRFELVTSAEPCAMCLGAVQWAGIAELTCGATDADVRAIGFDEGIKPAQWQSKLAATGISVREHVLQTDCRAVLEHYRQQSGQLY